MSTFKIAEAKARFSELVEKAMMGEEVIIARASRPVLRLVPIEPRRKRRKPGSAKGKVWMAPDFEAPLTDFDDYK